MSRFIYGIRPVQEALKSSPNSFESLYIAEGIRHNAAQALSRFADNLGIKVYKRTRNALEQMVNSANHQGVIARLKSFNFKTLDYVLDLAEKKNEPPAVLILDNIQDPQNLGAIVRSACAFGFHGVFIPERRAVGVTATVVKASAGATEQISIVQIGNLVNFIDELKNLGFWISGTSENESDPPEEIDLTVPTAIVIGNEGKGIRPLVKSKCDNLIRIPTVSNFVSLNASAAAAVILYELRRQRLSQNEE